METTNQGDTTMARRNRLALRGKQPSSCNAEILVIDAQIYTICGHMTPAMRGAAGAYSAEAHERQDGVMDRIWIQDVQGVSHTIIEYDDGTYSPIY
jgi:hypothetical protein